MCRTCQRVCKWGKKLFSYCIFAGISSDWWRISRPRCCHIDNKSRPLKVTFTPSVSPASCPQRVRTKLLSALFLYNFYCYSLLSKYILHFTCCIKWIIKHNECKYVLNEKNRFCSSAKSSVTFICYVHWKYIGAHRDALDQIYTNLLKNQFQPHAKCSVYSIL